MNMFPMLAAQQCRYAEQLRAAGFRSMIRIDRWDDHVVLTEEISGDQVRVPLTRAQQVPFISQVESAMDEPDWPERWAGMVAAAREGEGS